MISTLLRKWFLYFVSEYLKHSQGNPYKNKGIRNHLVHINQVPDTKNGFLDFLFIDTLETFLMLREFTFIEENISKTCNSFYNQLFSN